MGKPDEQRPHAAPAAGGGGAADGPALFRLSSSAIAGASSPRCAAFLILGVCALVFAVFFWLAPFHGLRSRFHPDADGLAAEIQASFVLRKPLSVISAHIEILEHDILVEIGVPESEVSIVSLHSIDPGNYTSVVFSVLSTSKDVALSAPAVSVLRSSLIDLSLKQINLTLTPSLFGHPIYFEMLKFPGGITVIPVQPARIWQMPQVLFNFKLNNSISLLRMNFIKLENQLKFGLNLSYDENVFVQLTNEEGSTVASPVTVQASVLSNLGTQSLLPGRLKQLAEVIVRHPRKNLGLNHSVFGKVKGVQLSSYFQQSISLLEPPSPSPSPSPSTTPSPSPSPPPSFPFPGHSSSHAPAPTINNLIPSPCFHCEVFTPESPLPDAPCPESPTSQATGSTEPLFTSTPFVEQHPDKSPYGRMESPIYSSASFTSDHPRKSTIYPHSRRLGPASVIAPGISTSSHQLIYSSNLEQKGGAARL